MQEKTPPANFVCVDLNRNYGYEWGFDDEKSSPTRDQRPTEYRFFEPEHRLSEFCSTQLHHGAQFPHFGNLLIHPWGYNDQPTDDLPGNGQCDDQKQFLQMGINSETVGYTTNGDKAMIICTESREKRIKFILHSGSGAFFLAPVLQTSILSIRAVSKWIWHCRGWLWVWWATIFTMLVDCTWRMIPLHSLCTSRLWKQARWHKCGSESFHDRWNRSFCFQSITGGDTLIAFPIS